LGASTSALVVHRLTLGTSVTVSSTQFPDPAFARLEINGTSESYPAMVDGSRVSFVFTPTWPSFSADNTVSVRIIDQSGQGAPPSGYLELHLEANQFISSVSSTSLWIDRRRSRLG